ncbi:MAG: ABC transporter substrate-binding protein [Euryarchaeota archaeon]|nr:ABC transporter substrate-binding protein [Euryarchaeota archaeon]
MRLRLGHSPDADDAFLFYGMVHGKVDTRGLEFEHVLADIETLNKRAASGELEITAMSLHAYGHFFDKYAILPHGASIGDGYGPLVVSLSSMGLDELPHRKIAIPGELTTAHLALQLAIGKYAYEVVEFDRIFAGLRAGAYDAGLIIHEGQLTYDELGFKKVVDLGEWWKRETGLPLPLGLNCVRRDLGRETMEKVALVLKDSIDYGLANRKEALGYAARFGRGTGPETLDRFVSMYVSPRSLYATHRERSAVRMLLERAHKAGLLPRIPHATYVNLSP